MKNNKNIVKYDNSFNRTSLTLFTKVQSDVLISVLSHMHKSSSKYNNKYATVFSFSEIREMTGSKNLHTSKIKKALDALLDTKVEYYKDGSFTKANLFSHYKVNEDGKAEIVLTDYMSEKLTLNSSEYTILALDEYVKLPNNYSKELYRILRQFKHSGVRIIAKQELIRMMNPPKSYNEYDFVRKVLFPAIEENKAFFEGLSVNVKGKNVLPDKVEFKFKAHKKNNTYDKYKNKKYKENDMEDELLAHIRKHS